MIPLQWDFGQIADKDLVHFWGIRWVTVFKTILRLVCWLFIICFLWEDAEIVKEWKKILVCKWVKPKPLDPSQIG